MAFNVPTPDTAPRVAARWGLTDMNQIAETPRATIYKVQTAQGPAALKLYKLIGASGEGAAIPFLRSLNPGVGAKVHRVSLFRTAVLMDWMGGETLAPLLAQGREDQAIRQLAKVALGITQSNFRFSQMYPRHLPNLQRAMQKLDALANADQPIGGLRHVSSLFDRLIQSKRPEHVIHGDLHFENVFQTSDGPRLIDPKGIRADPAFEFRKIMFKGLRGNPVDAFASKVQQRASLIAEVIDIAPANIIQWTTVNWVTRAFKAGKSPADLRKTESYLRALLDLCQD